MAQQSLYREFRPQRFDEVLGQDHVVRALRTAVREGRVGHAYMFSGPRGTGKTSTARILAKVLNCTAPVDGEPCGVCDSCVAVTSGASFDVHEHDSASARGINELKAILDTVHLGTPGRTKVYILDEVHMLTRDAVAALLKTLEEPPPNVVFVLATTDPQKVPDTIRGRTQPFAFHLLPMDVLDAHVRDVAERAHLDVSDEAIEAVLREGRGSARDTLSALDRVAVGGLADDDADAAVDAIVDALAERDTATALVALARATASGQDARALADRLVAQLRDAFLSLFAPDAVALPDHAREAVAERAKRLGKAGVTRAIELVGETLVEMRHAPDPRLLLDVAIVRLTRPEVDTSPAALLDRLERLEQRLAGGASLSTPPVHIPAAAAPVHAPPASPAPAPAPVVAAAAEPAAPPAPAAPDPAPMPAMAAAVEAPADPPSGPVGVAAARAVLSSARAGAGATTGTPRRGEPIGEPAPRTAPSPTATARSEAPPAAPAPAVSAPPPPPAGVPSPTGLASAGMPDRDQLTLAWGDSVVGRLKAGTKARFLAGRFLAVEDGVVVFALPNLVHRDKCLPLQGEVEAALSAHFGVPVRMRLVAEPSEGDDGGGRGPGGSTAPDPEPDDPHYDTTDLVDVPPSTVRTPLDHLTEAFPGATLIVED